MAASSTKKIVVGVLGGGQLGRMMGIAAHNMGDVVVVPLDPGGGASPAGQVCNGDGFASSSADRSADASSADASSADRPTFVAGSFKDAAKIRELAAACDVLTVEIEHVNHLGLHRRR